MKNYFYSFFALAALLASCSSDGDDISVDGKSANDVKYLLSSKPFEFAEDTRVTFTLDNQKNQLTFGWSYNEEFGVFPFYPVSNSQVVWKLNYACSTNGLSGRDNNHEQKDTHYAQFDGEGWALTVGETYVAYQPFQDVLVSTPYDAVPVSMPNAQGGTLEYIGENVDFLYAKGTYVNPVEENDPLYRKDGDGLSEEGVGKLYPHVIFDFNHAISIVQVNMTNVPDGFNFDGAVISTESNRFITSGTFNVESGDVTGTSSTSSVSVSGCESDGKTFYVALFPTTTGECTVLVNGRYEFTVPSKNLVKGKAYRWTLDFSNAKELVTTYTAPAIRTGSSTYNTNAQNLLASNGSAENGTLSYSYRYKTIGGGYGSWSGWTTTAPTGIDAGVYEVKYKVEPASGYTGGVGETSLGEFTINKATPSGYVVVTQTSNFPISYYATYYGTGTITKWEFKDSQYASWTTEYSTTGNPSRTMTGASWWQVTVGGTNYNTATFSARR